MIAVDTNILVYAHRIDNEWHDAAAKGIRSLAEARTAWAIPWPCVHEFFGVVTRVNLFNPPSTPANAIAQLEAWFESPSLQLIGESARHLDTLKRLVAGAKESRQNKLTIFMRCVLVRSCKKLPHCSRLNRNIAH